MIGVGYFPSSEKVERIAFEFDPLYRARNFKNRLMYNVRIANKFVPETFLTLTIEEHFYMHEFEVGKNLRVFFHRMRRWLWLKKKKKLQYVWAIEHGSKFNRIHIHILLNCQVDYDYVRYAWSPIRRQWRWLKKDYPNKKELEIYLKQNNYGMIDAVAVYDGGHAGVYVSKYLTKDLMQWSPFKEVEPTICRRYGCSRLSRIPPGFKVHYDPKKRQWSLIPKSHFVMSSLWFNQACIWARTIPGANSLSSPIMIEEDKIYLDKTLPTWIGQKNRVNLGQVHKRKKITVKMVPTRVVIRSIPFDPIGQAFPIRRFGLKKKLVLPKC